MENNFFDISGKVVGIYEGVYQSGFNWQDSYFFELKLDVTSVSDSGKGM